ncbi:MAG TPA: Wzz/FepE/Etk N-terminal domain-containing protein [Thermomicrobiaceae bacterium]|nr:Wzz/FepE/Etk N-terminal domain-containing protein [Thermomicrobiaceae bacterium]
MELKDYLSVLWRRWYIVVLVPILVLAGVLYQQSHAHPIYTATTRLAVVREPEPAPATPSYYSYDNYYAYLASEYLLDDLVEVVHGNVFASDVAHTIATTKGIQMSPGEVQAALGGDRLNRILTITATSTDRSQAVMIAQAAGETIKAKAGSYFGYKTPAQQVSITTVQTANDAVPNTHRTLLLAALQVAVGLFAGILIAYFVEYLDDRLRSPETVSAALGVPVIGAIPNGKGR